MAEKLSPAQAHHLIVKWMRACPNDALAHFDYDFFIPDAISFELGNPPYSILEEYRNENLPALCDATWELCRRGYLRTSISGSGVQGNSTGQGYSITTLGKAWLANAAEDQYIPTETGQIAEMLARFQSNFGEAFHERAQEAFRCRAATAYMACCAMCGAATESILLALATARAGEAKVEKAYSTKGGRKAIEGIALEAASSWLLDQANPCLSLLKYWRDGAAHGKATRISEPDAFGALLLLLRFATLANDHWVTLTTGATRSK